MVTPANTRVIHVLRRNLHQALKQRQFLEAAALLERLKQEDPLALETRGLELEYLLDTGRRREALALAEQLLELYPTSARIHYLAGRVYYQQKNYPAAACCFSESLHHTPHWRTRQWRGKTYTQMGRFDEAEAILMELLPAHPPVNLDLAWLYERWGRIERALACVDSYLERHPGVKFADDRRKRLKFRLQDPETLLADVDTLLELDEEIPPEMLPAYIQGLLETGEGRAARRFIGERIGSLDEKSAAAVGWVCYHRQAYDLAVPLFLRALAPNLDNVKFLSALEKAALRCNLTAELISRYETYGASEKRLWGRIQTLRKRGGKPTADA